MKLNLLGIIFADVVLSVELFFLGARRVRLFFTSDGINGWTVDANDKNDQDIFKRKLNVSK